MKKRGQHYIVPLASTRSWPSLCKRLERIDKRSQSLPQFWPALNVEWRTE